MKILVLILTLGIGLCTSAIAQDNIDKSLAEKAAVVVRARLIKQEGDSKYSWYEVDTLKVLKNKTNEPLGKRLRIAAYGTDPGVPEGESTLYLEKYNPDKSGLWKLVGGRATSGVSNTSK